jgi:hypothetical protein
MELVDGLGEHPASLDTSLTTSAPQFTPEPAFHIYILRIQYNLNLQGNKSLNNIHHTTTRL